MAHECRSRGWGLRRRPGRVQRGWQGSGHHKKGGKLPRVEGPTPAAVQVLSPGQARGHSATFCPCQLPAMPRGYALCPSLGSEAAQHPPAREAEHPSTHLLCLAMGPGPGQQLLPALASVGDRHPTLLAELSD